MKQDSFNSTKDNKNEALDNLFKKGKSLIDAKKYDEALKIFHDLADQGDPRGVNAIGCCYQWGYGVEPNIEKAFKLYMDAAERGYPVAQRNVGASYLTGDGVERNEKKSLEWYIKAAQGGDAPSQNHLGVYLLNKKGVENEEKAYRWFHCSALNGEEYAQCNVGHCLSTGRGVEKNPKEALVWYQKSANQGNDEAEYNVGKIYLSEKKYDKAFYWLEKAALKGHSYAQYTIGKCYEKGEGVEENKRIAFQWFTRAADSGNFELRHYLSSCYWFGIGTDVNKKIAFEICSELSDKGFAKAQTSIACCYLVGTPIEKDYKKAFYWFSESSKSGNSIALYGLGLCFDKGLYVSSDKKKALYHYEESAKKGNELAQLATGLFYLYGDTSSKIEADGKKAFYYLSKSSNAGISAAKSLLSICYYDGLGVEHNEKKALELAFENQEIDDPYSSYALGYLYYKCNHIKNDDNAIKYLEKSASKFPNSYNLLSMIYLGRKDYYQSFTNAENAAKEENPIGYFLLAYLYDNGYGVKKDSSKAKEYIVKSIEKNLKKEIDPEMYDTLVESGFNISLTDSLLAKMQIDKGISLSRALNKVLGAYPLSIQLLFNRMHGLPDEEEMWIGSESLPEFTFNRLRSWNFDINPDFLSYHNNLINSLKPVSDLPYSYEKYKDANKVIDYVCYKYTDTSKLYDESFRKEIVKKLFPEKGEKAVESLQLLVEEYLIMQSSSTISTSEPFLNSEGDETAFEIEDKEQTPIIDQVVLKEMGIDEEDQIRKLTVRSFISGFDDMFDNRINRKVASLYVARILTYPRELYSLELTYERKEKIRDIVGRYFCTNVDNLTLEEVKTILSNTNHFNDDIDWYYSERLEQPLIHPSLDKNDIRNHEDFNDVFLYKHIGMSNGASFSRTCSTLDEQLSELIKDYSKGDVIDD